MSWRTLNDAGRTSEPLKPCPFCPTGGKPRAHGGHVYCEECHAATTIFGTQQEAADAWNTRNDGFDVNSLFDDDELAASRSYTVRR